MIGTICSLLGNVPTCAIYCCMAYMVYVCVCERMIETMLILQRRRRLSCLPAVNENTDPTTYPKSLSAKGKVILHNRVPRFHAERLRKVPHVVLVYPTAVPCASLFVSFFCLFYIHPTHAESLASCGSQSEFPPRKQHQQTHFFLPTSNTNGVSTHLFCSTRARKSNVFSCTLNVICGAVRFKDCQNRSRPSQVVARG